MCLIHFDGINEVYASPFSEVGALPTLSDMGKFQSADRVVGLGTSLAELRRRAGDEMMLYTASV